MRNFFSIIIIFGFLVVAGAWVWKTKSDESTRQKIAEEISNSRRTFGQLARTAVNESENDRYLRAIKTSLASYKEDLQKRVYKDHPKAKDPEAYKKQVEEKFKKGELDEAQRKSMLEGYEIVKEAYDILMAGNWSPVLTSKGSGDTRLDIYTMKKINDNDGQPVLEGKFFFWGIEESTVASWSGMNFRLWKMEQEEVKEGGKKVMKDVEKVLGRSEGESQPHILIQNPQRYIEDFPSFVSVGMVWFPVFPREAQLTDIEYIYRTRMPGSGEINSALRWEKFKVPEAWKLAEGQVWNADVVEATEDEIAGKPENAAEAQPQ